MTVLNVAQQELRPSVENRRAHERSTSKRPTFNPPSQHYGVAGAQHSTSNSEVESTIIERSTLKVERLPPDYAASLSCFLRTRGSFLPSTTARLIVTSAISSRLGTSYMMSSIMRSSIERSAR